jgi:SAM-dependent methyltransferase
MKWFVDNYVSKIIENKIKVLDVGSYDVNGSYKHLFNDDKYEYYGLDMEKGPNVDIVLKNPYNWNEIETDSFDIVISGQAFEHIEFFWITMSEMARVLKRNGLLCIIAPHGFGEHRYPVDCYRFFSDGMVALARYVSLETLHAHTNCAPTPGSTDWYSLNEADSILIAQKNYDGKVKYVDIESYVCIPANQEKHLSGLFPFTPLKKRSIYNLIIRILRFTKRLAYRRASHTTPEIGSFSRKGIPD